MAKPIEEYFGAEVPVITEEFHELWDSSRDLWVPVLTNHKHPTRAWLRLLRDSNVSSVRLKAGSKSKAFTVAELLKR